MKGTRYLDKFKMWHIFNVFIIMIKVGIIGYVCYTIYENCFENDWAFDDYLAIYHNKDVDENANYISLWRNDIWGKSLLAIDSHRSYRPLLVTVFKVLRHFFGLTHSKFAQISVLSHCLATVLLYYTGVVVLGSEMLSFGAAMLFASHPVHVEVSNRACILCVHCYIVVSCRVCLR